MGDGLLKILKLNNSTLDSEQYFRLLQLAFRDFLVKMEDIFIMAEKSQSTISSTENFRSRITAAHG